MTIDRAIDLLTELKHGIEAEEMPDHWAAVQLGIEALKRCKEARRKPYFTTRTLLPGETEE